MIFVCRTLDKIFRRAYNETMKRKLFCAIYGYAYYVAL